MVAGGNPVDQCLITDCCLLTQTSALDTSATCECLASSGTSCDAEAKSRRGAQVVNQCPPEGEAPGATKACAANGENCRQQYLDAIALSGCCIGTVCKPNADEVPVCQTATADEQALARSCSAVAKSSQEMNHLELANPVLHTSVGDVTLPPPSSEILGVGPGGCLNSLDVMLSDRSSSGNCNLQLSAQLSGGKLVASTVFGFVGGCDGYAGSDMSPTAGFVQGDSKPAASFSFAGLACDANLIIESYCDAGTFDFHLNGTIGEVSFVDQHITLTGTICNAEPIGACPTP